VPRVASDMILDTYESLYTAGMRGARGGVREGESVRDMMEVDPTRCTARPDADPKQE